MTTSQQSRLGDAPEEGIKAPVVTISSGQETLFGIGQSIAGVVIADQDRVAINAQTDPLENGIYVARGGKDWVRATDMNNPDDVQTGQLMSDENTSAVYSLTVPPGGWTPGLNSLSFGLLLSPVGFFWGAITGTLSNQADLQLELDAKSDTGHGHVEADISDLQAYLLDAAGSIAMDGEFYVRQDAAWVSIDFSVFAPAVHTHVEADITDLQPYLLDAAGSIAMNDELYARANGGWQAFSTSSGTVGEIIAWPDEDPPDNFLNCDGSSQNAVTFADLFAVLGYKYGGSGANFNLPDLRGEFVRGAANGSGNDPDRLTRTDRGDGTTGDAVGTKQAAAVGPHGHTVSAQNNIGGFTDNGGAPDQRSTQQTLSTSQSGPGIEGDTRGRNVYMNYVIRWTGGGSGITSPPTIEVQDNGVSLTSAAQLFNFENFELSQPIADQITIRLGSSRTSGEYCPGYIPVFLSTTSWRIDSIDVTHSYSPGRRLRFIDGASNYYGTIVTSVFSGGNTVITMSMDTGLLTSGISEVCFTTSATSWSPISQDPFAGNNIADIKVGTIGSQPYVFAVGNGGRAAWSDDGGLTWTTLTTGTSEHLRVCAFDALNEVFWMGGNAGVLVSWDGSSVTLDTTSIPAISGTGPGDINGMCYSESEDAIIIVFEHNTAAWGTGSTTDQGASWQNYDQGETFMGENKNCNPQAATGDSSGPGFITAKTNNTGIRLYSTHDDITASNGGSSSPNGQVRNYSFWDVTIGYIIADTTNRILATGGQWSGLDDVNITERVTDFSYSSFHDRMVLCGENGMLAYWDGSEKTVPDAWTVISSGFDPLVTINAVVWDPVGGNYIAVAANGQICRSSTGLGDIIPDPAYSGFTLIAPDPFTGSNISHIKSGTISGTVYWVACGGSLMFISSDAGLTWSAVTHGASGTVQSLHYSSALEAFVAGFSGGDLSYTFTGGTTWTADTTTVAALAVGGSNSINGLYYFNDTGEWLILIPDGGSLTTSYTAPDITSAVWTVLDVTLSNPVPTVEMDDAKGGGDNRVFFQDTVSGVPYFNDGNDTSSQNYLTVTANIQPRTALKVEEGTIAGTLDIHIGNASGMISFLTNTIEYTETIFGGAVNGFALASISNRYVAVGDAGEIQTVALADIEFNNWKNVTNPFTGNINAIWYDPTDNIMIAVSSNGEIGRSVDGIS